MGVIGSQRPLMLAQAGFRRDARALLRGAATQMGVLVMQAASDGRILPARQGRLKADVQQVVSDLFTGRDNRQPFAEDGITPLAPYPRALNQWMVVAVYGAAKLHEAWLRRHVAKDVFSTLRAARRDLVREQVDPELLAQAEAMKIFAPDPLSELDPARQWVPPHKWTDERGYRLSDRVWRTELDVRQKIDELIARALREGMGALDLAKLLEQYLNPEWAKLKTKKPYDLTVSYAAMRLARTEIARAFNQAAYISGYLNPYTSDMDVARSPNGDPQCPICPTHATIDGGGGRIRPAYPKSSAPLPPFHPHCMCHVRWNVTDSPATVTKNLRELLEAGQAQLGITPAEAAKFSESLLGPLFEQGKVLINPPPGGIQINYNPLTMR